jgi:hypothetical protein
VAEKKLYEGTHELSLLQLEGDLYELDSCRGLRPDQEGFLECRLELAQSVPVSGAAAGIPQDVYDHFVSCNDRVDLINQSLAIARRQVAVLESSLAYYVDARNNDISLMVDAMRSRAQRRKDPSLLLPFKETLHYASQAAEKALRTRRKNAEAAEAEEAEAEALALAPAL